MAGQVPAFARACYCIVIECMLVELFISLAGEYGRVCIRVGWTVGVFGGVLNSLLRVRRGGGGFACIEYVGTLG